MLFDVGNLITLGIVILALILFRLMDRGNHSLDKVRKYADRCKEDITSFIAEKAAVIKDYGIALEVERKSAAELMRRIQNLTREELSQKVQALAQIDERIREYDASLEELLQMTGRVQENLNRIRDESAFVENVGKKVSDVKEKIEGFEGEIGSISKKLKTLEQNFERDNAGALEKAIAAAVAEARSTVLDLQAGAETIGRKVEEHREAVDKLERGRSERLARDEERIEKLLTEAIDRAGSRADKVEEAALTKLREQAQERLNLIKASFEEKIKTVQDTVKTKLGEIQDQLKNNKEEWKAEIAAVEARQKVYSEDWKKDLHELSASAKQQQEEWNKDLAQFTGLAKRQAEELGEAITRQKQEWEAMSRDTKEEIISAAQERLDGYRRAQEEQYRQLSGIADDTARLEEELRLSMSEAINRVNGDFTRYADDIRGNWENASGEFYGSLQTLREELAGVDRELSGIKEKSFENVSKKLQGFEDEFLANLSGRSAAIDRQLASWQETMDAKLEAIAEASGENQRQTEARITDNIKKTIAAQGEKIVADLDRLKAETAAFEEGIREEMRGADESRKSFGQQLERDMEEAKNTAENEFNSKIGQYSLTVSDTLRQSQRDLETQIQNLSTELKQRMGDMETTSDEFRKNNDEWQSQYSARIKELDNLMEETRRRNRELDTENDERLTAVRASLEDIRREVAAQAKLFDRTGALKAELDRHVEDMSSNIERLAQLKTEIAHFENQFTQIKRLEDDVNAKMTRFLSEKRRIEVMENDFNRLLQTSQSVEEKLTQVSNSDDVLQTMQVQIRRLEDVIKETEDKYQRVERKSKTLQETNDGIDRNFRALQEDEQSIGRLEETIAGLKSDIDTIQNSVTALSAENEKARDAADKLSTLDETVKWLEKRIAEMNVARESLARMATELLELDKAAQNQLNLTRSLLNREEGKLAGRSGKTTDEGAPPPRDRENVIKLKRQGWTIDEIARSMNMSKGAVELILEIGSKDI